MNSKNLFIFAVKPKDASPDYGYLLSKKKKNKINRVIKFIEKPDEMKAKKIINQNGYWNSGIVLARKDAIINNAKKVGFLNKFVCFYKMLLASLSYILFGEAS